jgi:hypothetical protein
LLVISVLALAAPLRSAVVTGEIVDSLTGRLVPARLDIQGGDGRWFFAEAASPDGSAIRYEKRNWINTNAVEMHATLSAHQFRVELLPGGYTFSVERGKEYRALIRRVEVADAPVQLRLPLHRWIDMARRGWFSGDTHVHRALADLPNVMLAEDLNVAFPLTYWVTKAFTPPTQGDKNSSPLSPSLSPSEGQRGPKSTLIRVDPRHVIWPRNTEWEIFTVNGQRHHLGAVFALGHQSAFPLGAPPVAPIAERARREGALLDLDKHDWPWSMMLVPVMGVDLYELANNHIWRTEFGFSKWNSAAGNFMGLPGDGWSGTERDWIEYGCRNYYTLLNCGFRLRPSAGTANGVHPVPLGFGRVYVQCPGGFSYEAWLRGLDEGRSFVTTGPMLLAEADGRSPGCARHDEARQNPPRGGRRCGHQRRTGERHRNHRERRSGAPPHPGAAQEPRGSARGEVSSNRRTQGIELDRRARLGTARWRAHPLRAHCAMVLRRSGRAAPASP